MGNMTITINGQRIVGDRRQIDATLAFSASYATGGDSFTPGLFGLSAMDPPGLDVRGGQTLDGAKSVVVDIANSKVKLYTTDGNEAGNATDQSAVNFRCLALGYP